VAHTCDLACGYCFAGAGGYGSAADAAGPSIMPLATAERALDFLFASAPRGRGASVDFFGGEPLLAWRTVTGAVAHGRRLAAATGRDIAFTLTTNGQQLDDEQAAFCAQEMATVIVSIDGRPGVHDLWRRGRQGQPSYDLAVAAARRLQRALAAAGREVGGAGSLPPAASLFPGRASGAGGAAQGAASQPVRRTAERPDRPAGSSPLWARGTYTRHNLDFWRDVEHLAGLGFGQVSMEPVSARPGTPYALAPSDLPAIEESYWRIADLVAAGKARFFHFELNVKEPSCAPKRYTGCAAGAGYGCVNPQGVLYPCHQFDGQAAWAQGSLDEVVRSGYRVDARLAEAHVGAKPACRDCWAQLHCGGGCHFAAWQQGSGSLLEPDPLACAIMKVRLRVALALEARRTGQD
jgi:uncharacterized protein